MWIFEPWLMTPELQQRYGCVIGQDYPEPIISVELAIKAARKKIAEARLAARHSQETKNIVRKHASRKFKPQAGTKKTQLARERKQSDSVNQQDLFQ
jgi:deoxyribodipyrimidine photo-lyase